MGAGLAGAHGRAAGHGGRADGAAAALIDRAVAVVVDGVADLFARTDRALAGREDAAGALGHARAASAGLGAADDVAAALPIVITTDLRLNEPRYVTLPNIMKAKKKQMDIVKPEDLGVDVAPRIKTLKVSEPAGRKAGIKVPDVATLVAKLKNEAKVI